MNASYLNGLIGGMLIGTAALILFWCNGRIMGISGIASRVLSKPKKEEAWRWAFLTGLVLGGVVYSEKVLVELGLDASLPVIGMAGLLVGVGTVLANGCTSGHGVCGIARLSKRSITATVTFMAAGMITVWLKKMGGL